MPRRSARLAAKLPSGPLFERRHGRAGGRSRGVPTTVPRDLTDFLRDLVNDPEVQEAVRHQIVSGKEGGVQLFLEAVAHVLGRPRDTVKVEVTPDLARLLSRASEVTAAPEGRGLPQGMDGVSTAPPH